ncbi:ABC transporter ATP-binding protein [Myceligenerans xiligouense]|uniref:ABC-2 type transport system ATP-binding protein n=1 Tax=Myceligenerans xiligouense TaxID=253184 RepID=A0A3N4YX79_9MICO|nr:ABC transporter ATP-binding protein [Myceligenerans xiligouense]RPF23280.1 ABC-2 type transport system ATP-binding protein [Myceligenerans xiligouense]
MNLNHDDGAVVSVEGVTRTFGDVVALDDVSLDVGPGELVGLLGPNGAGKSTLLSLVSGLRRPDSGTVRLLGKDPTDAAARAGLGMTPQETGLPATLRVGEVVDFVGGHYPDAVPTPELLTQFGIEDLARRQTGSLSGGQRRRLAVALAMAGRPRVVLLDEPTTGLDVAGRTALWDAIRDCHRAGVTVLLTSHYLEEIQALAERVVVIDHGRVLADDSLAAILERVGASRVSYAGPDGARQEHLVPDSDEFVRDLVRSGTEFTGLEIRHASLEEAFTELTKGSADGPGPGTAPTPPARSGIARQGSGHGTEGANR